MSKGPSGPGKDDFFANTGVVNKSNPQEGKGKTNLTSITGQRDSTKPGESYVEIKGPTMVGARSSIAYTRDVVPYKKKAEQAIDRQKIPKQHQERVRKYFESLTKG